MSKVTFEFDNDDMARHFLSWLNGAGEQDYWLWREYREQEEFGKNITANFIDYQRAWQTDGSERIVKATKGESE